MMRLLAFFIFCFICPTLHTAHGAENELRYIGHAAFQFTADDRSSLVIDPYNDRIWLGYKFPENIKADAVAITHPHYDHDASYHFSQKTAVYRDPGQYQIGSIKLRGVATEHGFADSIRKRGYLPLNTVWIVDINGVRFAHFGDTRPPTDQELKDIGPVDYVITNLFGRGEIMRLKAALNAVHIIPMHYHLPDIAVSGSARGMTGLNDWLAEEWSENKDDILRLNGNTLNSNEIPKDKSLIIMQPIEGLKAWNHRFVSASEAARAGTSSFKEDPSNWKTAIAHLKRSIKLAPGNIDAYNRLAAIYSEQGKTDQAILALEDGVQNVVKADWGRLYRAHATLAAFYSNAHDKENALRHHRWIYNMPKAYGIKEHTAAKDYLKSN